MPDFKNGRFLHASFHWIATVLDSFPRILLDAIETKNSSTIDETLGQYFDFDRMLYCSREKLETHLVQILHVSFVLILPQIAQAQYMGVIITLRKATSQ